jgi:ribosomal protein S17
LSTATNIVKDKDKDVLVVIEQNNTIYSVHQIRYVNRDTNIHASNLRNDVIAAISGIAAIESRPSTGLSAASSSSTLDSSRLDSSRLGSASTISSDNYGLDFERKTPPGTPRIPDDYLDVSKLPERLNTSTTRNIDSSAKQFIAEYNEKSSPEEKGAHLKTVTTETEQKQIIKAISDIEPKHGGLDPPSVLHSHFIHNNKLAQTNKSSSNDFSRAKDMNNKELGIGDTVKVIKSQTTGIKPNDIATIHNILPGNNVVIRRESYATNKTVKGDTLLIVKKFRGGGTRRKRTTKSNNKTRSNRNKNI